MIYITIHDTRRVRARFDSTKAKDVIWITLSCTDTEGSHSEFTIYFTNYEYARSLADAINATEPTQNLYIQEAMELLAEAFDEGAGLDVDWAKSYLKLREEINTQNKKGLD